jgi:hypothetical protein
LASAIDAGEFALLGKRGEKTTSATLFEHLDSATRQADASRRITVVIALTVVFVLATAGAYYKFSG